MTTFIVRPQNKIQQLREKVISGIATQKEINKFGELIKNKKSCKPKKMIQELRKKVIYGIATQQETDQLYGLITLTENRGCRPDKNLALTYKEFIQKGYNNSEIARMLGVSRQAVSSFVKYHNLR